MPPESVRKLVEGLVGERGRGGGGEGEEEEEFEGVRGTGIQGLN